MWKVNGLINDCGKIVGAGKKPMDWFDVSTLKEPYRIEGKKTMGLELAEQLGCAKSTAHVRLNSAMSEVRSMLDPKYRDLIGDLGPDEEEYDTDEDEFGPDETTSWR